MTTGGFKRGMEAHEAVSSGATDLVGLARTLVLNPSLPNTWSEGGGDPTFPVFKSPPAGGVTAWYSMQLTNIGEGRQPDEAPDVERALHDYEARDAARELLWNERFS